jgi:transcription initiation factor TFIIB
MSKKNRHSTFKINKRDLWNIFDTEVKNNNNSLECLYSNQQIGNREVCDECASPVAYSEEGFLTCCSKTCGIIYKDIVDQSAEWRFYGADDSSGNDPTRCGLPINPFLEESSYGCRVLFGPGMSYEMRKIRRYTEWQSMPYKEKTQFEDFQIITAKAQMSGIPKKFIDDAISYHKKVSEYKYRFRGDNKDAILAASIYIACRINGCPRTAKEIAQMCSLDVASATKGCKVVMTIINDLEKDMDFLDKTNLGKTKPEAFIQRFCSKLGFNTELTRLCQFICLKIERNNMLANNTPHSIAAGVVYFVAAITHMNVTKKDVKAITEISEVTICKCFKRLDAMKEQLVPSQIQQKYNC